MTTLPDDKDQRPTLFKAELHTCFQEANDIVQEARANDLPTRLGALYDSVKELGAMSHAAAGVVLTLAVYKVCDPLQDITAHKSEHPGGFSARTYDSDCTVPFLIENGLPRNVESHWLTQTFSFAGEFRPPLVLRTQPRRAGPLVIEVVSLLQASGSKDLARAIAISIFVEKIEIRNKGRVTLTRPKNLSIQATVELIRHHLGLPYKKNGPRLPQLVFQAVYLCLMHTNTRYSDCTLEPLARMKAADRKASTVGDVVVSCKGAPFEAVELKSGQSISKSHVAEAIEKVRSLSVLRYYLLSTHGIAPNDEPDIEKKRDEFLKQNGCEIIVNGVFESLSYYLRLLPDTFEFVAAYADLVENDADTDYEHRISWNECCKSI